MSRPSKFPGLASIKLDEPVPPHALLVENTTPASAVIARLGDLQRIVLLQLALSGTGKQEPDSSTAEKNGAPSLCLCTKLLIAFFYHPMPSPCA